MLDFTNRRPIHGGFPHYLMAHMKRLVCLSITALAFWGAASVAPAASVREAWVQRYNSPATNAVDHGWKVIRDPAGNVIVAGTTSDNLRGTDVVLLKYSGGTGTPTWSRLQATAEK